jgi:AcrR family transcriptional regulator
MFIFVKSGMLYNSRMPYLNHAHDEPEPLECRILTAALDLFVTRGYHNVSVHDVQREAGVSIGSIYNHFGGKEGMARALYDHLLNEMEEMVDSVMETTDTARDRCEELIRKLFEYTETHPHIISFVLHAKHTEFISDKPPICSSVPFRKMRQIVQDGIESGEFRRTDPWVAAAAIFGGAIRMIHLRLDGVVTEPLSHYIDEIIEAAWLGMAANRSSSPR